MASKQLIRELQEDVTCPICMEILKDPVIIDCGHNFCLQCINEVGEASENFFLCPLCKASVDRSTFRPNKLLASLAEKIQATEKEEAELRCQRHSEKLLYFCEEDREHLCFACRDSKDHKSHNVILIEEAAQTYQEQIQTWLQNLGQEDKKIVDEKQRGEGMIGIFKARVHLERLKIQEAFKFMKKNLEDEERFLLARLRWLEQEGDKQTERYGTVTAQQLSSLRKLLRSLRIKQQMSPRDLLQDIKVTLTRCQECQFTIPTPVAVDLEERINDATSRHESTIESMKKFIGNLEAHGENDTSKFLNSLKEEDMENFLGCLTGDNNAESPTSAPVTLNEASADPDLTLSQDLRKLSLQHIDEDPRNKQANPRPFEPYHCVLGSQGLSSGCLVWEAELQGTEGQTFLVGVAMEPAPGMHSRNHFWALRVSASGCQPITSSSTGQNVPILLSKVGIFLNCDSGEVIFFNPATNKHIYTFQTSFKSKVFPLFGLLTADSHITLSP